MPPARLPHSTFFVGAVRGLLYRLIQHATHVVTRAIVCTRFFRSSDVTIQIFHSESDTRTVYRASSERPLPLLAGVARVGVRRLWRGRARRHLRWSVLVRGVQRVE